MKVYKEFSSIFLGKKYVFFHQPILHTCLKWPASAAFLRGSFSFLCWRCLACLKLINSIIKAILLELSRCILKSTKFFYARVICFTLEFVIVSPANLFHKIPKSGVQGLVHDCVMILRILKFIGIRLILSFARRINKLVIRYMASLKAQSIC